MHAWKREAGEGVQNVTHKVDIQPSRRVYVSPTRESTPSIGFTPPLLKVLPPPTSTLIFSEK